MNAKRYKRICLIFDVIVVLTGTRLMFGQTTNEPEETRIRPSLEFRFDIGGVVSVTHGPIPLAYRQIPHHPSDPNYTFVVPNSNLSSWLGAGQVAVLPGVTLGNRVSIRGGPLWQALAFSRGAERGTTDNSKEINQYGVAERGYGTSLVYYAGAAHPVSKIGYIAEADVRVYKQMSIVGGYSASSYEFNIQRGYDRYDALEKLDVKPYSNDSLKNPYFGIKVTSDRELDPFVTSITFVTGPAFVHSVPVPEISLPFQDQRSWVYRLAITFGYIRSAKQSKTITLH